MSFVHNFIKWFEILSETSCSCSINNRLQTMGKFEFELGIQILKFLTMVLTVAYYTENLTMSETKGQKSQVRVSIQIVKWSNLPQIKGYKVIICQY